MNGNSAHHSRRKRSGPRTERVVLVALGAIICCALLALRLTVHRTPSRRLAIAFLSKPDQVYLRQAARRTYLRTASQARGITYDFFVGNDVTPEWMASLKQEAKLYGDVTLLTDVGNSDSDDTIKVLSIARQYLRKFRYSKVPVYALFVRSDVYVNVTRLSIVLEHVPPTDVYLGKPQAMKEPVRHKQSEWYIRHAEYQFDFYPPYMSGPGYLVSFDLLEPMAACLPLNVTCVKDGMETCKVSDGCTFHPIHFHDVTVGGIVLNAITRSARHDLMCTNLQACGDWANRYALQIHSTEDMFEGSTRASMCSKPFSVVGNVSPEDIRGWYLAVSLNELDEEALIEDYCLSRSR